MSGDYSDCVATESALSARLASYIAVVPDFPRQGIAYQDLSPLYTDPGLLRELAAEIGAACGDATHVLALEARGFPLGTAVALATNKPLVFARKPGKLPGELHTVGYGLEYGTDELTIQQHALTAGSTVLVVDDVLATGGTLRAAAQLIAKSKARLAGFGVLLELAWLGGRSLLPSVPLHAVRGIARPE